MIWLYIHLGLSALTFLVLIFTSVEAANEFKRLHPDIKIKKTFIEQIGAWFKIILMCLFPIFNIILFVNLLFNSEKFKSETIYKLYIKYSGGK